MGSRCYVFSQFLPLDARILGNDLKELSVLISVLTGMVGNTVPVPVFSICRN
jgi:hypothetical protein